jgi:hypothetical protein
LSVTDRELRDRALRARIGANHRWARESDRTAATQPARDQRQANLESRVDPDGTMPADERARRAAQLRRAEMLALSLKSAKVRRKRTST